MNDPIREILTRRRLGMQCGIPSFCSADQLVIEVVLEEAQGSDASVLIEATANQVNQFGGYRNMRSVDFREFVYAIADRVGFDRDRVLLGGDHLGPLPWAERPAAEAMAHAKELVRQSVLAGFRKIHLDTSMPLGGDDPAVRPAQETIAARGADLYLAAEAAFAELLRDCPGAERPAFVIGSEVPAAGGTAGWDDSAVTTPEELAASLSAWRCRFRELGLERAWSSVVAVVVHPGAAFSGEKVRPYDRGSARPLCRKLDDYPDLVFEGHSTDFQPPERLREMVEDGIAILKVGPALTYALREALHALSLIEKELIPAGRRADYIETLERAMLADPSRWQSYYSGDERRLRIQRRYSFSDRSRYYTSLPAVRGAMEQLFHNLDAVEIPLMMVHQYLPLQYPGVRDGRLPPKARDLAKDCIRLLVAEYQKAAGGGGLRKGEAR
ncbi:MAG: class II D-tagatose-bisphosphate aldolase non-catalytic subunit [Anaerovoracaceae bacterium]|jgi:D-tagatose-1,6-bisphosphate aldolase subunit GatZ/KbaZ